jgi:hypothetical protein
MTNRLDPRQVEVLDEAMAEVPRRRLPHHRSKSRMSFPTEAGAWNCAVSTSTEIAAHSRFQPIKRRAVTEGPS